MPAIDAHGRVTLHLKTERQVRDRVLGTLRSNGITMQEFFDSLLRTMIEQPGRIEEMRAWWEDQETHAV